MSLSIQELYSNLLDVLAQGVPAAVVSEYQEDGEVDKRLVSAEDLTAWAEIERLEALPNASICGPVTSIFAGDAGGVSPSKPAAPPAGLEGAPPAAILIEHYTTRPRMVILGAGHIAARLAPIAKQAEFELLVYDDRASFANAQNFPDADTIICDGFPQLFKRVRLRATDYVVIVTRGHRHDIDCLRGILAEPEPAYTGMIGSQRRVAIVMDQLRGEGCDACRIERIHSPIGLKIGAVTPFEIAISIIAEVIKVKRLGAGGAVATDVWLSGDVDATDVWPVANSARQGAQLLSCDTQIAQALAKRGDGFDALITIYKTEGSVPIDTGAKLAMTYAGELAGSIGGGCSEAAAMQVARDLIRDGGWRTHTVDMTDSAEEDGMVCGGMMEVIVEKVG